ncbi:MAG: RNA polymerase factor sigma-54 [Deltaproteobacteria bacterium]|nr:RNA polymerase factor sigma-54 [Deltaproteobacteria bacterium]
MALEIKQQLRQTQQLVMTPQLQQAIKLLQYNHLEMLDALEQEVRENPLLEVVAFDEHPEPEADNATDLKRLEEANQEPDVSQASLVDPKEVFDIEWENYMETYGADYAPSQRDQSERPPIENLVTYKENLFDHLIRQLQLSALEEPDRRIAFEIIGNLKENGFLDASVEELAELLHVDVQAVERALTVVQGFDPPGIAARNLRECLLIQAKSIDNPNELAIRILEAAFDLFQKGKIQAVARKLKEPIENVKAALKLISTLDPNPGRAYNEDRSIYIVPDIYIIKVGDDYTVVLNDDGLPRLRICSYYQRELHNKGSAVEAKGYIQEKLRGAMWLIKSIHQRQRTIYRVTQSIIKFQREFFDKGIDYLKPLILKDVADDIEMHESTISRVTTNKYVHSPRGTFELKYFFNSGIRHGADAIASESVKNHILRIVKHEDPKKPASDKQIADELARSQIHIARRTVAKYRELLSIPPSSKRKKKF